MSLFSSCCGEGEEEDKFGPFVDPNAGWDDARTKELSTQRLKITKMETQITRLNQARPNSRGTIYASPVDLSGDYQPIEYPKSRKEFDFLEDALKDNFIFMDLTAAERKMLIGAMQNEDHGNGNVIIQQGDVGDYFYILWSGTVDFWDGKKNVGKACSGDSFGELALLYNCPRAVSCVASSKNVSLYKVDQKTFRYLVASHAHGHEKTMKELVRKITLFNDLDDCTVGRFTSAMTPVHWKQGTRIVQKGETGSIFYILQEGRVKIHDIGLGDSRFEDQIFGPGDWFGERALLTGEPRAANVTALTDVTAMAMDRETFEISVGPLQDLIEREMRKKFLRGLPMFANSNITDPELDQVVTLMKEVCYRKGEKLVEAGKKCTMNLWIIRHGKILVYGQKSETIFNLQTGDHFGDKSVISDPAHISSHTAICEENLTAWVLSRDDIESVVGDISRMGGATPLVKGVTERDIRLQDISKRRVLGQGAFGKVWLVSHAEEETKPYALKMLSKRQLLDSKQETSVLREKELLSLLEHPFILHLICSFQDEDYVYLLLPVIPGGELFSVLHKQKIKGAGIPNYSSAFYVAVILQALGHFHQRSIAYRDLKLENCLLDAQGYCVIVDLGFAKVVDDKTYTLVGTPEYLAPEIIMSKGYDKAVDYWALGVLCYELLVGRSPFFKNNSSQISMFKRIVLTKYTFPDYLDPLVEDLIQKLLVRRQSDRLGNLANGYIDIKKHQWFETTGIDFKAVLKKSQKAPWVPTVSDPFDSSNFDDYSDIENEIDYGKRLTKDEQVAFAEF